MKEMILRRFFSFDGRINVAEYWILNITIFSFVIICLSITDYFLKAISSHSFAKTLSIYFLNFLIIIAFMISSISVGVRRLHDLDKNGSHFLVALIPVVNVYYFLIALFIRGKTAENEWGIRSEKGFDYYFRTIKNYTIFNTGYNQDDPAGRVEKQKTKKLFLFEMVLALLIWTAFGLIGLNTAINNDNSYEFIVSILIILASFGFLFRFKYAAVCLIAISSLFTVIDIYYILVRNVESGSIIRIALKAYTIIVLIRWLRRSADDSPKKEL